MDTYGQDFAASSRFVHRLPFYGVAVMCTDDPNVARISATIAKQVVTYGFSAGANIRAENVRADAGKMHFDCVRTNGTVSRFPVTLNLPGEHNVRNALAAIAVATEVGAGDTAIQKALAEFQRVWPALPALRRSSASRRWPFHADRRLRPPSRRDGGDTRRRARRLPRSAHRAGLPAAPLHADTRLLRGFRKSPVSCRCGAARRSLCGGRSADRRGRRAFAGACTARRRQGRAVFVEDIAAMPQAILDTAQDGDVVVTLGAGSIGSITGKLVQA